MAIHTNGRAAETSAASFTPNNDTHFTAIGVIPTEQALRNKKSPAFVDDYLASNRKTTESCAALKERLKVRISIHLSLIRRAPGIFSGTTATLIAHKIFLDDEMLKLDGVIEHRLRMQAALQSIDKGLDVNLVLVKARKTACAVSFPVATIMITAAATAFTAHHKELVALVAGSAATVLFASLRTKINSLLKKSLSAAKKNKEIIEVMIKRGESTINDLKAIYLLARRLNSEAEYMLEMDGDAVAVRRKKLEALQESFLILQRRVRNCNLNMRAATEAVLRKLDYSS